MYDNRDKGPTVSPKRKNSQRSLASKPFPLALGPIPYRRMADQIGAAVRNSIVMGKLPPNTHLRELDIAREMQTSRVPVREALMQLEREGLVVRQANRGTFVAELTEEIVREVASLRGLLEGFAASLAAERLTTSQFAVLDAMVTDMKRAAQQGEYARLVELDYQFHDFICRGSGHRTLYETWQTISGKVRLYLSTTNLMYRNLKAVARGHGQIVAALRSRDAVRAGRVIQDHPGETLDDIIAALSRRDRGKRPARSSATVRESRWARRIIEEGKAADIFDRPREPRTREFLGKIL